MATGAKMTAAEYGDWREDMKEVRGTLNDMREGIATLNAHHQNQSKRADEIGAALIACQERSRTATLAAAKEREEKALALARESEEKAIALATLQAETRQNARNTAAMWALFVSVTVWAATYVLPKVLAK